MKGADMLKQRMQKLAILTVLSCGALQMVHPAEVKTTKMCQAWRACNHVRNIGGQIGQCIAGYTIFETIKKFGTRDAAKMLISEPMVFPTGLYLLSLATYYGLGKYLDVNAKYSLYREDVDGKQWKALEAQEKDSRKYQLAFVGKVLAGWLWFYSIGHFLAVAKPLSVSASSKILF
jgi:hypothetical protein